jgi:hypothetical protein
VIVKNGVARFRHQPLCRASDRRAARITKRINEKCGRVPCKLEIAGDAAVYAGVTGYSYDEST